MRSENIHRGKPHWRLAARVTYAPRLPVEVETKDHILPVGWYRERHSPLAWHRLQARILTALESVTVGSTLVKAVILATLFLEEGGHCPCTSAAERTPREARTGVIRRYHGVVPVVLPKLVTEGVAKSVYGAVSDM